MHDLSRIASCVYSTFLSFSCISISELAQLAVVVSYPTKVGLTQAYQVRQADKFLV
jgi:hypothetical protein